MDDVMVSIRMPSSLLEEIRMVAKEDHFMDVSEEIRTLLRDKWLEAKNPTNYEIKKIHNEVTQVVKNKTKKAVTNEVITELKKIIVGLKEGPNE